MKKLYILTLILILQSQLLTAQTKVMTLGTFHFSFGNMDIQKIEDSDQIDVLRPEYQKEIEKIVGMIARFKPTHIAIEVDPDKQSKIDSVYQAYLSGKHKLRRSETEQIGFRLAKQFNLKTLYCVNDWGNLPDAINEVVYGPESAEQQKFMEYFYNNSDSSLIHEDEYIFKTDGIIGELRKRNTEEEIKKDFGNYFISIFKYETENNESFGVDFTTGWWFNRNLQIFRNIQKIPTKPGDRIVVIYGSGHLNVLNPWFDASPEYELVKTNDYLK